MIAGRPTIIKSKLDKYSHIIIIAFFLIILIIGYASHEDYGISTDELTQRRHGLVAMTYLGESVLPALRSMEIIEGIPSYPDYRSKNYGVIFHLPILFFEKLTGLDPESSELWKTRHLYTFLWFYAGLIFFYLTIKRWYGWKVGLLGSIFMVLSPRIFAHSFYNVKDLAFLSTVMIVLYFSFLYLEKKNVVTALMLSVAIALSINVRVMGVLFIVLVLAFSILDFYKHRKNIAYKDLFSLLFLTVATLFFTFLFWPASWESPLTMIYETLVLKSDYTRWDGTVIYLGELVRGQALPWHYSLVWIAITTPILYLSIFFIGVITLFAEIVKTKFGYVFTQKGTEELFCLLAFILPILSVIILGSTLYSGWRHLFFVYVPFLLLATKGLHVLWCFFSSEIICRHKSLKHGLSIALAVTIFLNLSYISVWMIINHPYQYVYFNLLAGSNVDEKFDRDYWRLSTRAGLEYIVNYDDREEILIRESKEVRQNMLMLKEEDRKRLKLVEGGYEDYWIVTYRNIIGTDLPHKEVYAVAVDSITIMSVFDMR